MYIFVYGTLKSGLRNHHLLSTSRFIKKTKTKPYYKMYSCGSYPCIVECKSGVAVEGEVYEIDENTLRHLDRLEGVPYLYDKDAIMLEDFHPMTTAYFYQNDVSDLEECGTCWE